MIAARDPKHASSPPATRFTSCCLLITIALGALWTMAAPAPATASILKPTVTTRPSPNHSSRSGTNIDTVVLHTTEGGLSGSLSWLANPASKVSAHYVIAPGGTIYQMVDDSDSAWHATYYNNRSIGIEMVGYAGQASTWNTQNLSSLINLLAFLVDTYNVDLAHPSGDAYDYPNDRFNAHGIIGHGQIQPWNRSDPGIHFPWNNVLSSVANAIPEPASAALLLAASTCFIARRRP